MGYNEDALDDKYEDDFGHTKKHTLIHIHQEHTKVQADIILMTSVTAYCKRT